MRIRLFVSIAVSAAAAAMPLAARADDYSPTGPLVADSGFRPQTDGFGFANYGSEKAYSAGLGVHEMRALFGDGVCGSAPADDCALTDPALAWEQNQNQSMGGGHCFGFSITALRIFSKQLNTSLFAPAGTDPAPTTASLAIETANGDPNWPLAHMIAYDFALQGLDSVAQAAVTGTPKEIVQKLIDVLPSESTKEQYSMSVFKPGFADGHEITPYAVEDKGNGVYGVLAYDNNYPLETHVLTVDTNADTWSYNASQNPSQPPDLYQGDATTKTLQLTPVSSGLGVQPCPFCGQASGGGAAADVASRRAQRIQVHLSAKQSRHAHLLIQDARGGVVGYRRGKLVNRMRGARILHPTVQIPNKRGTPEPNYTLDPGRSYTITLDDTYAHARDTEAISVTGPAFDAAARSLNVSPGEKVTFRIAVGGRRVTLRANRRLASPALSLGATEKGPDHGLTVRRRTGLRKGQTLSLVMNTRSDKLTILGSPARYDMVMRYVDVKGAHTWARRNVNTAPVERNTDQVSLDYGSYDPSQTSTEQVDLVGDGTQPIDMSSQVPADVGAENVIDSYDNGTSLDATPPDTSGDPADSSGDASGGTDNSGGGDPNSGGGDPSNP